MEGSGQSTTSRAKHAPWNGSSDHYCSLPYSAPPSSPVIQIRLGRINHSKELNELNVAKWDQEH